MSPVNMMCRYDDNTQTTKVNIAIIAGVFMAYRYNGLK